MSLIGYVRQVRPIQESHVNHLDKVQSLLIEGTGTDSRTSAAKFTQNHKRRRKRKRGFRDRGTHPGPSKIHERCVRTHHCGG